MHVVTGASEGIGRAVAIELAARGESVLAVARSRSRLEALEDDHPGVAVVVADLTTESGRERVVAALTGRGLIDSIVHCAGSRVEPSPLVDVDVDGIVEHFRIHVAAVIAISQELSAANGLARLVIFDSYSATTPRIGWGGYSIVKAAAQMTARLFESEMTDVEVLRLYPGAVRTGLLETVLDSSPSPARDVYRSMASAGAIADPADIARWAADLIVAGGGGVAIHHYADGRQNASQTISGGCLCGGVRYRIEGVVRDVIDCHCERCRRTSGNHVAATRVSLDYLTLEEESSLQWFPIPEDPNVEYGFCGRCGSSMFWRAGGEDDWSVFAGTLDSPTGSRTKAVWYTDQAADHSSIDPTVPAFRTEPRHDPDGL